VIESNRRRDVAGCGLGYEVDETRIDTWVWGGEGWLAGWRGTSVESRLTPGRVPAGTEQEGTCFKLRSAEYGDVGHAGK